MKNDLYVRIQYEPAVFLIGNNADSIDDRVINFKWNLVATSSSDMKLSSRLANDTRMVCDIFKKTEMQANILDKKLLHIVHLLGKEDVAINITDIEKEDLEDNALSLLNRIVSIISRNGIIVIENFDDEIISYGLLRKAFKNLYPNQQQVYIFNYSRDKSDKYINNLIESGIVSVYEESINDYFVENIDNEEIDEIDKTKSIQVYLDADQKSIPTAVDKNMLLETESFATLLNLELMNEILIPEHMYKDYFYMFLKNSVREPQWYGYKYGFNLHRAYEDKLYRKVKNGLENAGRADNKPVLVVGQTGSGKSISIASIAYKIFNEKKYPVIFINDPDVNFYSSIEYKMREITRKGASTFNALDRLLEQLEDRGAKATLLVWDTSSYSSGRDKSYRLYQALLSRGRKVFMLCTAYEISKSKLDDDIDENVEDDVFNRKFVECASNINLTNEIDQLKDMFTKKFKMKKEQVEYIVKIYTVQNQNFLSMLYQSFEVLRIDLSKGVYKEANLNLREIDRFISTEFEAEKGNNIFALALKKVEKDLIDCGIVDKIQDVNLITHEKIQIAKDDFIKCIAICSQFKFKMPYDFALRILGTYSPQIIRKLTQSTFFVIDEDYYGNYQISIRTPLEARMFLSAKNVSILEQIDCIKLMLKNMQPKGAYSQQSEVRLCEKLIRIIGPNNREYGKTYRCGYGDIIEALRELREVQGVWEPILVSQEITYMREYYGRNDEIDGSIRIEWLKKAISIADKMLSDSEYFGLSMGTRNSVIVETANSKLLLCQLLDTNDSLIYKELRRDLRQIIQYDNQDYHAYVTLLKASIIEYENEEDDIKKIELLEAMCTIADQIIIENHNVADSEYFQRKVAEIYGLLVDTNIAQKYVDELIENGSAAGIYVYARKRLLDNDVDFRKNIISEKQFKACEFVYNLFNNDRYKYVISDNESCQYMLLNIVWLKNNQQPIYREGECWRTYMSNENWNEILNICNNYLVKFCSDTNTVSQSGKNIKYIKALSLAQLGQYIESKNVLRSIEEDSTMGLRRVYTKHMICEKDGTPRKFVGRLGKYDEIQRNGIVYIDEFGREGIYYHGPHLNTSRYDEGIIFTDLEVGLSNIAPRVFREIEKQGDKYDR